MASSKESTVVSGQQEEKEQGVIDVVFLCDEWKSSKGGLSTFNREFAINLAQATVGSMKIHCYVTKSDDQDREDARQHGLNLITAKNIPGSTDSFECLKIPPSELRSPHLVIGHGRKFGLCAYFLVKATMCQWIQFVHVYCEDLGKYKKTAMAATDTIEENEKKHKKEIDLCKAADAVVAVGSRLQKKYSRSLPNVKVEIITPGIFEKFSCESQFAKHRSVVKNFNVFLFGRATFEDLSLKGYDIVANAIGSLSKNFELTFVGSSPGEHQKVEEWFLENTDITRNQLTIRGYCSDPEDLKVMFHQSDLVALPSRTEGFGLVALEAISAGVPILVSSESGVAETFKQVEGGNTVIVESDEDADGWARRIRETSEKSADEREANAMKLRENYRKVYSWETECARFREIIENVMKTANDGKLDMMVEAEELKTKEPNMQTITFATWSGGCQEGQYQSASDTLPKEGNVSHSGTEDPQAFKDRVLCSIAMNYLQTTPPQSREDRKEFQEYLREMRVILTSVSVGSLVITVRCDSLQILEELWKDYISGHLGEMVQNCFVTEKILKELNLAELKLKTSMDIEEYKARKYYFERVQLRDVLGSQSYFVSFEDEAHLEKRTQKIEVEEPEKMKETLPTQDEARLEKIKRRIKAGGSERVKASFFSLWDHYRCMVSGVESTTVF
ncbi:uncharacterized protein LOC111330032 isoform X2 [Stylophora pistillata]|uniref:uncharacterized protein LOC111330032 isoform X2 n=1 Tax=Stylophora pistillata TaxID=50429 RepID=UPI000C03D50C|nr:uncharacterized protein LOC111330032 isoform X2 [Stylophora pistillata]